MQTTVRYFQNVLEFFFFFFELERRGENWTEFQESKGVDFPLIILRDSETIVVRESTVKFEGERKLDY